MAAKIQYLFGITKENGEEDSKKNKRSFYIYPYGKKYFSLRVIIFSLKGKYIPDSVIDVMNIKNLAWLQK